MSILLSILAIYYLTTMVVNYDGAFEIFERLRKLTREYRGLNLDCFFCTALWISLPFAIYLTSGATILIYWFGLAGAATIINEVVGNE